MPQDPFPLPPGDAEEPGSSPLPPAAEGTGPDDGWEGMGQGLYVCLPPEQVTLAGFAQNGEADTMGPGPLLATIVDTVAGPDGQGLAGCSDDQLMGIISAARRMAARDEWTLMAAIAEYAARHAGSRPADEFAPVELGFELHLSPQSAAGQMQYSASVATRLPAAFAALASGQIHPFQLRIIAEETSVLSDADAAQADTVLAGSVPRMTFGQTRAAARTLVLKLDPEAARKRKEAAKRDAHVRPFREDSGNAGMVARELPSDEVLASWQHVEQRAVDLRAAGMPGSLRELRVRAYLDLLQERDSRDLSPTRAAAPGQSPPDAPDQPPPGGEQTGGGPDGPGNGPAGPGNEPGGPATDLVAPAGMARAALAAMRVPLQARVPGRAWPPWSPSPSPGPPTRANPTYPARPTGSGRWTATTPAPWPPPRPGTPGPGGASPRCTPTAPPPRTPACPAGIPRPAPASRSP